MSQSRYLDLSCEGSELESKFDVIIGKMADLCKPASIMLAGEQDYFNLAKSLPLEPFRKQEFFDKCIRKNNDDWRPTMIGQCSFYNNDTGRPSCLEALQYPYANPMSECMLADENLDNLRNIIVSSLDIEWRMLTPKRPSGHYELGYFDLLISLHRNRFKYRRLECGAKAATTAPHHHDTDHHHHQHFPSRLPERVSNLQAANDSLGRQSPSSPSPTQPNVFRHTRHAQCRPNRLVACHCQLASFRLKSLISNSASVRLPSISTCQAHTR